MSRLAERDSLNTSQVYSSKLRGHRSRRLRRESRNVVSFSGALLSGSDSESSDDDIDRSILSSDVERAAYLAAAKDTDAFSERTFIAYHEKLTVELDELVRFIRRSLQTLLRGSRGSSFEVFAFSLEDWDL